MKSLLIALLVLASFPMVTHAEDSSNGCGLGWQVTDKKSFLATTTRDTTNVVVPPTFGMTTGTIGCEKHSFAAADQKGMEFVAVNFEPLTMQLAEGRGEYVQAFAATMNCQEGAYSDFGAAMQKNYKSIVGSGQNSVELYQNVKSEISKNPALASRCNLI